MDRPWSLDVGGGVCRAGDLGFGSWAGSGTIERGSENGQGFAPPFCRGRQKSGSLFCLCLWFWCLYNAGLKKELGSVPLSSVFWGRSIALVY